jgi:steroid delta-isomerase
MTASPEQMEAVVAAYVEAFAKADPEAIAALYAPDGVVVDPLGAAPIQGRPAILDFYARAMELGARLALTGPVRVAQGAAAFAFQVSVPAPQNVRIDVIDVMEFNTMGQVARMTAYWGPTNVAAGAPPP